MEPQSAKRTPATPLPWKLDGAFAGIRNIVPVTAAAGIVGEVHMHRRSGWRGGPSYQFYPNELGKSLGLKSALNGSVRALLRSLREE